MEISDRAKGEGFQIPLFKAAGLQIRPNGILRLKRHKLFEEKTKIEATPTVLVNGYSLPQVYDDQDLVYYLSQYI